MTTKAGFALSGMFWCAGWDESIFFILNFPCNRQFFSLIRLFVKLFRLPYVYFYNGLELDSSYGLSALAFFIFLLAVFADAAVLLYVRSLSSTSVSFCVFVATAERAVVIPEILEG